MDKKRIIGLVFFILLSLGGYAWIGYGTMRTNFLQLISIYAFLFALYMLALRFKLLQLKLWHMLGIAILLRLSFILVVPNLSDDYFRYIWDGLIWIEGYNPYLSFPAQFAANPGSIPHMTTEIYQGLNSPDYYTVYPPFAQLVFGASAAVAGGSILGNVLIFRALILLAEAGTIILLYRTSRRMNLPPYCIKIYAFNPLVIIELTGNLHFEAFMLFFLALALYLLIRKKAWTSAISLGLSAAAKLVSLVFLPLLIKRLGIKKSLIYVVIAGAAFMALLVPFLNSGLLNRLADLFGLYFQKFEFNAGIYYLLRWLGYILVGYDTISILGPALALIALLFIVTFAAAEKDRGWNSFARSALLCITAYYLLATTVHPWYITTLILFGCLTPYRYPVAWSAVIFLSYSAYAASPFIENFWLIGLEYTIVGSFIAYEFIFKKPQPRPGLI